MSFSIQRVDNAPDFLALEPEWRLLATQMATPSIFSTWEWAIHWWEVFLGSNSDCLRIFVVRDENGTVQGIVPLYCALSFRYWGVPCHSHEWRMFGDAGHHQESLTEEPIFLVRAGYESAVLETFLTHLQSFACCDVDYLKITHQLWRPEMLPEVPSGRIKQGYFQVKVREGSAIRPLPADWKTLRKEISRSMRDNTAYYPKLLARHGHEYSLSFHQTQSEVSQTVPILIALHQKRAKNEHAGAVHLNHLEEEHHHEFLMNCLPALAAQGKAILLTLCVGEETIAAQVFLEEQKMLTVYYSGFDTKWHAYSPLLIILQAMLEDAMERGVQVVNFLPDTALWKSRWGAEPVLAVQEIRLYRTTPLALLRGTVRRLAEKKK